MTADRNRIQRDIAGLAALNRDARDAVSHIDQQIAALRHRRLLILGVVRTRSQTIDRYLDEINASTT